MTREEAIERLNIHKSTSVFVDSIAEAIDMAIEALQAPTDGDLIRREDAIEAIQTAYCTPCKERGDDYNEVRCRACDYDNAIMQIDALPSADRPQGEWISNHDGSWNCSECGLRVFIYAKGNYCPNCGARMKGGAE